MITKNVNGINAVRASNKLTADSVRERNQEVIANVDEINRQMAEDLENAAIATRAIEQEVADKLALASEEAAQLYFIATGKRPEDVAPAEPLTAPVAAEATPEPTPPLTTDEPAPPAPPAEPVQTAPTAVLEPQEEIGLPVAQIVTEHHYHYFDPRGWEGRRLLFAIILGLLGLFIGIRTVGWVVSDWNNNWWPWFVVTVQIIFGFIWVVAWTNVGFFGGSLLGDSIGRHDTRVQEERRTRDVQLVPPAPTPPAA